MILNTCNKIDVLPLMSAAFILFRLPFRIIQMIAFDDIPIPKRFKLKLARKDVDG